MTSQDSDYLQSLLKRLAIFREQSYFTTEEVERELILGKGWMAAIESGDIKPSLDVIATLLSLYNKNLSDLSEGLNGNTPELVRSVSALADGKSLLVHFAYAAFDATYRLKNGSPEDFNKVVMTLRDGLSRLAEQDIDANKEKSIKSESVAEAFMLAISLWPDSNPSDIWWFVIYRAYCDKYNHPAKYSRLDLSQSWKRTAGWALEKVVESHYAPELLKHGINLEIADKDKITHLLEQVDVGHRLEADKIDIILSVGNGGKERLIGVIHVKASFAERRTDDVPMSQALVKAGYISPLWTMDCKSMPSASPINRGELGKTYSGQGHDSRSAKRKDIEDDGYFSACFSYNSNTKETPSSYDARARIRVCNLSSQDDEFVQFIVKERNRVREELGF